MRGGAGGGLYYVFGNNDRVVEAIAEGVNDFIHAFVNFALEAGSEVETIVARPAAGMTLSGNEFGQYMQGEAGGDSLHAGGGDGNDLLYGGLGDDWCNGDKGNDRIHGEGGDDTLLPGRGFDQMTGGGGNDHFRFFVPDFEPPADGLYQYVYDYSRDLASGNFDKILLEGVAADYQFLTTSAPGTLRIIHIAEGASIYVVTSVTGDPAVLAAQVEYFA
jgi:Ca2+-binding RTX toxin-like protein